MKPKLKTLKGRRILIRVGSWTAIVNATAEQLKTVFSPYKYPTKTESERILKARLILRRANLL